jgi:hypothetical protein
MLQPLPGAVRGVMLFLAGQHEGKQKKRKSFQQDEAEQKLKSDGARPSSQFHR